MDVHWPPCRSDAVEARRLVSVSAPDWKVASCPWWLEATRERVTEWLMSWLSKLGIWF